MKKAFILFITLFNSLWVNADFGYEIVPRLIDQNNYTYQISLLVYGGSGTLTIENRGELDFGDGRTVEVNEIADSVVQLGDEWYVKYYTFQHTYPAPGSYQITYTNYTRNMELNNFANSYSSPLLIQNWLVVDPLTGVNELPLPKEASNVFTHVQAGLPLEIDLGMVDPDGDSLSYSLVNCSLDPANEYTMMPGISIDTRSGILSWGYPQVPGLYAVCIKTDEFKRVNDSWIKLSHSTRDYTLMVVDEDGRVTATDQEEPDYLIYPNPVTNWLHLPVGPNETITIFDLHGKFISSHHGATINVSHLKSGTFLLKYGRETTKFVKK